MARQLPDLLSMMRSLVKEPSISSADPVLDQSNLKVIDILAGWLESLQFTVEIQNVSESKANLIATLGKTTQNDGLVLSGHTDTVPFDESAWTVNPFDITERDRRFYGLGAADMKSFFAMVLEAASQYREKDFDQPLVVLATADEESSMAGARKLMERGTRLGRYAVIGEPTNLQPVRMHKGVMMESIVVNGAAGHSSNPSLGANALEGMQSVLTEILAWRKELQSRYRDPIFEVDVPTLNLGSIHGGDNPNRICAHCETQIDIRPLPGMDLEELRFALKERVNAALVSHPRLSFSITSLFSGVPSFETPQSSMLVATCERLSKQHAGAVAFGTEAPYLSQLGMETIVMGPGSIDQAHNADEYIAMNQLNPTVEILRGLINRFCVEPEL